MSQVPRASHRFAEQTRSGRVVENFLSVRIKAYFSPQQHGNLAEVARRCRTVRDLTRCDSRFPALYTIEKIPPMTGRFVQVYLVGAYLLIEDFFRLGLQPATVNPDPPVGAHPFCAAPAGAVPAGDNTR